MTRFIYRACNLPIIVDVDIGFGETLNVARTEKEMFESKAAKKSAKDLLVVARTH
ncbi:Methylisocitrate lyase [Desulfurella amilsii]|uniref:Methylisocitrate lyase n=1 Tax=Desulfurella amilsii TaxID=1562698 RepID=A0A1X4XVK4_9BACT|nr:hypothetical protein [Desulfurella amilsii]OSS41560.1 Methylisocitrate lyase [Desulfurella amilsii]